MSSGAASMMMPAVILRLFIEGDSIRTSVGFVIWKKLRYGPLDSGEDENFLVLEYPAGPVLTR